MAVIVCSVVGLVTAGTAAAIVRADGMTWPGSSVFVRFFHLDRELGVPAMVSVLGLACCGALLLLVSACLAARSGADARRWRWLGVGFFLLAIDEGASIHERLTPIVREWVPGAGDVTFAWVVLGIALVLVLVPIYVPAVLRIPRRPRALALAASLLYVAGAIGAELVGSSLRAGGRDDPGYLIAMTIEETLELAGIGTFLVSLWLWWRQIAPRVLLEHRFEDVAVRDDPARSRPQPPM